MDEPATRPPPTARPSGVSGTSVGMFAIVACIWLFSLLVVGAAGYGVGRLAFDRPVAGAVVAVLAWTASAAALLVRPVEAGVARLLFPGSRYRIGGRFTSRPAPG